MVVYPSAQGGAGSRGRERALLGAGWVLLSLLAASGAAWARSESAYVPVQELMWRTPRNGGAVEAAFGIGSASVLARLRQGVRPAQAAVLFASYENPWGGAGGLLAVAKQIWAPLAAASATAWRLSPLHAGLRGAAAAPVEGEGLGFTTAFAGRPVPTRLVLRLDRDGRPWHLLHTDWAFFKAGGGAGGTNPYSYRSELPWEADGPQSKLLRDALFFCQAVAALLTRALRVDPATLPDIGTNRLLAESLRALQGAAGGVVLHANDWQTAAAVLTLGEAQLHPRAAGEAPIIPRPLTQVLTLHNLFDHYLPAEVLAQVSGRCGPEHWPALGADGTPRAGTRETVLSRMLPLLPTPPSMVSVGYAQEIVEGDPLARVFGGHLREMLQVTGLTGIPNGNFMEAARPFPPAAEEAARRGEFAPILAAKRARRAELLALLDPSDPATIIDPRAVGGLDRPRALAPEVPIFFFFGRFDAAQKGFDVIARAIEQLERKGVDARYVFSPAVDDRNGVYWKDLEGLTARVPGKVLIFPFRMERGYLELMRGATAAVMASNYEPFGAATEPLLSGTPVVARLTGGLVDQVPDAVGWTYREAAPGTPDEQVAAWRRILDAPTPAQRMDEPLYRALVDALADAMTAAGRVYRDQPDRYGALLAAGHEHAQTFNWQRPVAAYQLLYSAAARGD